MKFILAYISVEYRFVTVENALRMLTGKRDRQIQLQPLQKVRIWALGHWYYKSTL